MKKDTDEYILTELEEGDTLYHYTSAEGLQGILGGEFWITESRFLRYYRISCSNRCFYRSN